MFDSLSFPDKKAASDAIIRMLDILPSAGRATYYNKLSEQEQATGLIHQQVFDIDRGLYALAASLPGSLDYSRQLAITRLLDNPKNGAGLLTDEQEFHALEYLISRLPIQRILKLFVTLRKEKVSGRRIRRLILRTILNQPNLQWIAVKYRKKLRIALIHALQRKKASVIQDILYGCYVPINDRHYRFDGSHKASEIITDNLFRHADGSGDLTRRGEIMAFVSFVLGNPVDFGLYQKYDAANRDPLLLAALPPEVAQTKRANFHPNFTVAAVTDMTTTTATEKQKMRSRAMRENQGASKAEFDPMAMSVTELYVYLYEQRERNPGFVVTDEILSELLRKAWVAHRQIKPPPHIVVLLDQSHSMRGSAQQRWRPIAAGMAMKNALLPSFRFQLEAPYGGTAIARDLLRALTTHPDMVYIISDGYENQPAGRTAEVVAALRRIGNTTPIIQLTPVVSAEDDGVRPLSPDIPCISISSDPQSFLLGQLRSTLQLDFDTGVEMLMGIQRNLLVEVA